jgi:hypothetical protein
MPVRRALVSLVVLLVVVGPVCTLVVSGVGGACRAQIQRALEANEVDFFDYFAGQSVARREGDGG